MTLESNGGSSGIDRVGAEIDSVEQTEVKSGSEWAAVVCFDCQDQVHHLKNQGQGAAKGQSRYRIFISLVLN